MNPDQAFDPQRKIDLGPVTQVGIVVRDAEASARAWTDRFNIAPAKILDWPPEGTNLAESSTYRGKRGNFRMRMAFIETPSIQIEFIQPLEGGSVYAEFLEQHGEGLHHLLFLVKDPEGVAMQLEVPIALSGASLLNPGALWAYLDTQELLGCMIELKTKL